MDADEHLLARLRDGEIAAFDVLYGRYESRLFAYLRAMLGRREDAEEVLHDAFLAALDGAPGDLGEGGFRAWLYRSARNRALNHRRGAMRRDRALAAVPTPDAAPSLGPADEQIEERQLEAALAEAVRKLPGPLGELYHLRSSGLSYEQIASVVDAPLGTVKSRMHQMVHALREELRVWIAPE